MLSGFNILPHGFEGQTEVNIKMVGTSDVLITLRDQSFITKRGGGYTEWENHGSKTRCVPPPPSRWVKTVHASPTL